jgi:hypothetical protein
MVRYEAHKPFYTTEMKALNFFAEFSKITSGILFIALWYGKDVYRMIIDVIRQKRTSEGENDIHNKLMNEYQELPEWMWGTSVVLCTICAVVFCHVSPFHTPIWAAILAVVIGIISTYINGFLIAISGSYVRLSLLADIIMGYLIPGQTVPFMVFRSLESGVVTGGLSLVADLKLSHYLHIPPIAMIAAQILGVMIGIVFNTLTTFFILDVMVEPKIFVDAAWNGRKYVAFVNSGGLWGAIGTNISYCRSF